MTSFPFTQQNGEVRKAITNRKKLKYGHCPKKGGVQTLPKYFGELFFNELYTWAKCPGGGGQWPAKNLLALLKDFSCLFPLNEFYIWAKCLGRQ